MLIDQTTNNPVGNGLTATHSIATHLMHKDGGD
nr:MAG TPA: hypothetical protein [Caudoviricetes sp.]